MNSDNKYYYNGCSIHKLIIKLFSNIYDKRSNNKLFFNKNDFDFRKLTHYYCKGYDLVGSKCDNLHDPNRHFLIKPNHYEVWELPYKDNEGLKMTGDFFVLFKDIDNNIWIAALMNHNFEKSGKSIIEEVSYACCGEYHVSIGNNGQINIQNVNAIGKNCVRGFRSNAPFDSDDIRKEKGYHTTWKVIERAINNSKSI